MNLGKLLFPPPKKDRFAQMVMDILRKSASGGQPQYDPTEFSISVANGKLFLTNAYAEYCTVPLSKRKDVLRRYAALGTMTDELVGDFTQVKPHLLPRVRDRFYYEEMRFSMEADDGKVVDPSKLPPHKLLNDHLLLELVIDYRTSVVTVSESKLKEWGLSFDEAMKIGTDNLWAKSNEDFRQLQSGLYASPWRDNHDASRLLLHDLIWQLKVKGEHIAAVPNRDVLLVTGTNDVAGIQRMATAVMETVRQPRPMSYRLFLLEGKQWVPLVLPRSHPAYWQVKRLELLGVATEHHSQKQALEKIYQKSAQDIFVANDSVLEKKGSSECFNYAVWVEGVDTLLPKVDTVAFGTSKEDGTPKAFVQIDWRHLMDVVGDLMKPQGMYPERYRVQAFPTVAQLAEMKARQEGSV